LKGADTFARFESLDADVAANSLGPRQHESNCVAGSFIEINRKERKDEAP
jgi:hypothetical protein